jgi:transketolase
VREGSDVTLAATGGILGEALRAADLFAERGISCRVLSVHTIKPLDTATLAAAANETGGIVSVEEHNVDGGLGGAIAESLLEAGVVPRWFLRMGLRNTFSSVVGSQQYLRHIYALDAEAIAHAVSSKFARAASSAA